jgi:GntR family transcriptional regulator/MocR family aminotransferase
LFPRAAWSRAARSALLALPKGDLAVSDPRGLPLLRGALAEYLARVRGVTADPEQVLVCEGFGHGFDLVAGALAGLGYDRFAVEDPGYSGVVDQLRSMGIPFDGVAVDRDGLLVERLRRARARVVVVTPAHQSPTGVVLAPDRRRELVEWAREVDGYVIEDDYDAEYRYDRRPVGSLQGIAPERVIYGGTTSKSLAPGLRLGWFVLPPELMAPIVARRRRSGGSTSAILQATFAAFLANGDLDRHLRRARRSYRPRRDAVIDAVQRWLPGAIPNGVAAGLNVLVMLPAGTDERAVVQRALAAGVRVYPLEEFRVRRSARDAPGLILGYGAVPPGKIAPGVRLLAQAVADLRQRGDSTGVIGG